MARGRPCSICSDPATKKAVNAALLTGDSVADVYRSYGEPFKLSEAALYRHARHAHDPKSPLSIPLPEGESPADNVRVLVLVQRSQLAALTRADARGDEKTSALAADKLRAVTRELLDAGVTGDHVAGAVTAIDDVSNAIRRAARNRPDFALELAAAARELRDEVLATEAEALSLAAITHNATRNTH